MKNSKITGVTCTFEIQKYPLESLSITWQSRWRIIFTLDAVSVFYARNNTLEGEFAYSLESFRERFSSFSQVKIVIIIITVLSINFV